MKKMKLTIAAIALSAVTLGGVFADGHGDNGIFKHASKIKFDDIIPGVVAFATVAGDREKGEHGTFVRIPAGQATPMHTHGAAYHAVVIAGIFENPIKGDDNSNEGLSAGSYYYVPKGAPHISRCAVDSPTDCITYFHQTTAFDFAVAE